MAGRGADNLEQMTSIVHEACGLILEADRRALGTQLKSSRRDMVTDYDKRVQAFLVERLSAAFPGVGFFCEEGEGLRATTGERFVIDPIDGTSNFVHGVGMSAISVALVDGEEPVLAVVENPFAGETFAAVRGGGATLNQQPMPQVADVCLADSLVCVGTSLYFPELYQRTLDLLARRGREFNDIRRTGSAACDLCMTAAGRFGLFFEYSLAPWDYAAGSLIAEECGCRVGTMEAGRLSMAQRSSVLVGAPRAVEEFLEGERVAGERTAGEHAAGASAEGEHAADGL